MKILFFSDIHGIKKNLTRICEIIEKENPDKIVVLGDLYCQDSVDNEYIHHFLMNYIDKLIVLKGNCDSDFDVKNSEFPICSNLAFMNIDEIDIYLTHGNEYNYDKNEKFNRKGILIYGHEHIPYIRKKDDMVYICVGSISLPRNEFGETYMIYNDKKFTIYNIDNEVIDEYKEENK